jgi:hypothetical protein
LTKQSATALDVGPKKKGQRSSFSSNKKKTKMLPVLWQHLAEQEFTALFFFHELVCFCGHLPILRRSTVLGHNVEVKRSSSNRSYLLFEITGIFFHPFNQVIDQISSRNAAHSADGLFDFDE